MNAHIGPKIRLYVSFAMFLGSAVVFGLGALSPKAGGALEFANSMLQAEVKTLLEKPVFEKIVIGDTKKTIDPSKTKSIKTNILGDYTFTLADFKTSGDPNKVQLFVDTYGQIKMVEIVDKKAKEPFVYKMANNGKYTFSAVTIRGGTNSEEKSEPSDSVTFEVNKRTISPESIEPSILEGPAQRSQAILVKYPKDMDLSSSKIENSLFKLSPKEGQNLTDISAKFVEQIAPNIFRVLFDDPVPAAYVLKIGAKTSTAQISDDYGNTNDTEFSLPFSRSSNTESTVSDINDPRGLRGETGKNASFQEFDVVPPENRQKPGFNPEDKVETRVVRLYYTRDAHRVARILNRTAQSYNRLGLDTQRSGADRARREADALTDDRRRLDRLAIQAAGETRAIEAQIAKINAEYQNAQANTAGRLAQLQSIQGNLNRKLDDLNNDLIEWKGKQGPLEQQVQIDEQAKAKRQTDKANWDKQWKMEKDAELDKETDLTKKSLIAIKYDKIKANHDQAFDQNELIQGQPAQTRKDQLSVLKNRIASIQSEKEAISQNAPTSAAAGSTSELDALKKSLEDSQRKKIEEINQLTAKLENLRNIENQAREASLAAEAKESRAREDQFRREVAAAMEDPDTYAQGQPGSKDTFERVSISVIGEGLIQLRGPMKGINNIRRAIHEIDAPLGQVRLGIHTVQINGERGERMEKVATRIQTYLDQSRFLTSQSAQMLRKAVAKVASERAYSAPIQNLPPNADPTGQLSRDYRYLVAFFGADFLRELQVMDSEFLRTGNKLLSLHSMDSTSLASTLFLISLAKNEVRREILEEFDRLLQTELPNAEYAYITPMAATCDKQLGHKGVYQLLAAHARFQSLRGFLNGESVDTDGLNPTQREFLRLAQILKGQVIAESELKQRVMERSLIEQRIAEIKDPTNGEDSPAKKEREAREAFQTAANALESGKNEAASTTKLIQFLTDAKRNDLASAITTTRNLAEKPDDKSAAQEYQKSIEKLQDKGMLKKEFLQSQSSTKDSIKKIIENKDTEKLKPKDTEKLKPKDTEKLKQKATEKLKQEATDLDRIKNDIEKDKVEIIEKAIKIESLLRSDNMNQETIQLCALAIKRKFEESAFKDDKLIGEKIDVLTKQINTVIESQFEYKRKLLAAQKARQPLDHKKLMDSLLADSEDKFAELLEGTRAHTANIDNHLKAMITALDDDFNRQFYQPAFTMIRNASRYYDVTLGQVETTTVLANNRNFAKVEPQAIMEFDLPKRNIVYKEAIQGAKAIMNEGGALMKDETFLAALGAAGGLPLNGAGAPGGVYNVLPKGPGSSNEAVLAQQGPARPELGSALEALIPDQAIYKFETGTGFEIRPVIQPDGQAVVFNFNYMYTTNVREPVRADEKHLGRIKRHFINTDVQLSNYELREVSRYVVALKAARTAKGVPLFEDIPGVGVLFRPLASDESALQQNLIYAQATIFPTLFDLMGLRWAPAVADMDSAQMKIRDQAIRDRARDVSDRVYGISRNAVDDALRIPLGDRRPESYRTQEGDFGSPYRESSMQPELPQGMPMGPVGASGGSGLIAPQTQSQQGAQAQPAPPSRFLNLGAMEVGQPNGNRPIPIPPQRQGQPATLPFPSQQNLPGSALPPKPTEGTKSEPSPEVNSRLGGTDNFGAPRNFPASMASIGPREVNPALSKPASSPWYLRGIMGKSNKPKPTTGETPIPSPIATVGYQQGQTNPQTTENPGMASQPTNGPVQGKPVAKSSMWNGLFSTSKKGK